MRCRYFLGVKWSQVQILSARHRTQVRGGFTASGDTENSGVRPFGMPTGQTVAPALTIQGVPVYAVAKITVSGWTGPMCSSNWTTGSCRSSGRRRWRRLTPRLCRSHGCRHARHPRGNSPLPCGEGEGVRVHICHNRIRRLAKVGRCCACPATSIAGTRGANKSAGPGGFLHQEPT
jgi:hypothetical protein